VSRALPHNFDLDRTEDAPIRSLPKRLDHVKGRAASFLSELSFVTVTAPDRARAQFTILRDRAHTNVAQLFDEAERWIPAEDELTVVRGFFGAYPNALFEVPMLRARGARRGCLRRH
jgi:hypothetical protein